MGLENEARELGITVSENKKGYRKKTRRTEIRIQMERNTNT
jgi:hypothetical protein